MAVEREDTIIMSSKRVSEMTDAEIQQLAAARQDRYEGAEARDRARLADPQELAGLASAGSEGRLWRRVLAEAEASGDEPKASVARRALADLPAAGPLDTLAAMTEQAQRATRGQWLDMRDAREAGATWEQIGGAMGTSKQAASQLYRRAIEAQETYVPDFHHGADAERARAALGGPDGLDSRPGRRRRKSRAR
jgi:hypothetical protein